MCNRCSLELMKARARERGATVIVEKVSDTNDPMIGWISARYSDREKPSAYFMKLTDERVC